MKHRNKILVLLIPLLAAGAAIAHITSPSLPEGCGSCHVGHGQPSEPMLSASEEQFCYTCHGSEERRSEMKSAGRLAATVDLADIEREFNKPYRHPVEKGLEHSPTERLPLAEKGMVGHAECVDCHDPHQKIQKTGRKTYNVQGYSLSGQYLESSQKEYETCFKCHVDISGLSGRTTQTAFDKFAPTVRSQHPVTKVTRTERSVSLMSSASGDGTMTCSDCHTNDNPEGPRGPHGSVYRYLLSGNYETDMYADESPFAYQFCYSCHDRSSILGNQSFPLHREHIQGDRLKGIRGTSCATCHSAHSSLLNPHLIEFNREAVGPDGMGRINYIQTGTRTGECYLNCHGHEHSPGKY